MSFRTTTPEGPLTGSPFVPPAPRPFDGCDIVTIEIPTGKAFAVHAHLLKHYSRYFKTALESSFIEATTRHFKMIEHATEATLSSFIRWIYAKSVDFESDIDGNTNALVLYSGQTSSSVLDCWLFGDYIQAAEFQKDVVAALCVSDFDTSVIPNKWDLIPEHNPLRLLLVEIYCRGVSRSSSSTLNAEQMAKLPHSMLIDVSARIIGELTKSRAAPLKGRFNDLPSSEVEEVCEWRGLSIWNMTCLESCLSVDSAEDDISSLPGKGR